MPNSTSRRRVLRLGLLGSLGTGVAGCADALAPPGQDDEADRDDPSIDLKPVAEGFASPVGFEVAPDETDRYYVVDQPGRIYAIDAESGDRSVFLDIRDRVALEGLEMGLLGLAFHPEHAANRRLFVRYSSPRRPGTPESFNHTFVLAEFEADSDGDRARPGSERTVLEIPQPQSNHNAGAIAFGPNGYLYVAVGDGGAANDTGLGHVDDWYEGTAGGNGQDVTENLLGSLLRLDIDERAGDQPYAVPRDNPLVGRAGLDEHYAWGLRNPWRLSFAGEELFVADVGQSQYEEVNLVENGENYGWNVREGAHCFGSRRNEGCPNTTPDGEPLVDPIIEYSHEADLGPSGIAVIGGYLYEGSAIPSLTDAYVFGDWNAQGRLFVATRPDDGGGWPTSVLSVDSSSADRLAYLLSFGRDHAGELYALTTRRQRGGDEAGGVYRLVRG